jgi:hypothetical protein
VIMITIILVYTTNLQNSATSFVEMHHKHGNKEEFRIEISR